MFASLRASRPPALHCIAAGGRQARTRERIPMLVRKRDEGAAGICEVVYRQAGKQAGGQGILMYEGMWLCRVYRGQCV
jgi:hypothetical protein